MGRRLYSSAGRSSLLLLHGEMLERRPFARTPRYQDFAITTRRRPDANTPWISGLFALAGVTG